MSDGPSAGGRWDEEDEAARMSTPELKPETPITDRAEAEFSMSWRNSYGNAIPAVHRDFARSLESALNAAREALKRFATAELNESNCASVEIANKRIRYLAKAALAQIDKALSPQQSKTT